VTRNESEVEVTPGSSIQLGPFAKLQVDAVIESTVAVRNVFGNVAKAHEDVVIQPRASAATAASRAAQPSFARALEGADRPDVIAQRAEAR